MTLMEGNSSVIVDRSTTEEKGRETKHRSKSKNRERSKNGEGSHLREKNENFISNFNGIKNVTMEESKQPSRRRDVRKATPVRALYKELEKLLRNISPITINGIPVKNLTSEPILFLKSIVDDKTNQDEIFMTFLMEPSDPEFPFDLGILSVTLCIPQSYPNKIPSPTIMVLNDDIPRGYGLNIEIGFKQIVATVIENRIRKRKGVTNPTRKNFNNGKKNLDKGKTDENDSEVVTLEIVGGNDLSGMVKTLDKYLEKFLSMEKKDTIKLVKVINNEKDKEENKQNKKSDNLETNKTKDLSDLSLVKIEKYEERTNELEHFRQRMRNNNVSVLSDNAHGTTYKLVLRFEDDHLTVEFGESEEVTIEKLFIKLFVPKDYLYNPKRAIKLSVDMSNNFNIGLVTSIKDTNSRLIFGKLISNINKNFDYFAQDVSRGNCQSSSKDTFKYWTITSQMNFFVHNIQKFMNEKIDFQNWYEANALMNNETLLFTV